MFSVLFFFSVSRHFGRRSQASLPRGRTRTVGTALTSGWAGGPVQAHAWGTGAWGLLIGAAAFPGDLSCGKHGILPWPGSAWVSLSRGGNLVFSERQTGIREKQPAPASWLLASESVRERDGGQTEWSWAPRISKTMELQGDILGREGELREGGKEEGRKMRINKTDSLPPGTTMSIS